MRKDGLETALHKYLERVDHQGLQEGLRTFLDQYRSRLDKHERQESHDGLTGLQFRHFLEDEYERVSRNHQVISLLLLDIDHFRLVNDSLGHDTGDAVLQVVVSVIGNAVREKDACFRYGGEEFLVLLAGTNSSGALRFAERLRKAVSRQTQEALSFPLTVSSGIAECPRHSYRLEDLIRMAERALLKAKLDGRNRTIIFESELAVGSASQGFPGLASPVSNLPQQSTAFVGRQGELNEIAALLARDDCRLLTLTGPEGIGKTRLALEAASRASEDYPHGAYFVPLSRMTMSEHLASGTAAALSFPLYPDGNAGSQLMGYLEDKKLLLTMDGFEGIIEKGTPFLEMVIRRAPQVKVLVTSQERLGVDGERVLEIGGMGPPSVELFRGGAQRIYPGLTFTREESPLAERLCGLLEGNPLGIELAASSMRSIPLSQAASALEKAIEDEDGRDPLESVLEHSYGLLKLEEQGSFKMISIFPGGFKPEAAEEVAEATPAVIASLMSGSLLRRGISGRYEMHGVVRSFGLERLAEEPLELERARDLFSNHYLRTLQDCEIDYLQSRQPEALAILEEEAGNIREAWAIALEDLRMEEIDRSISALYLFFDVKGWLEEGEALFGGLVDLVQASVGNSRPHRRIEKEVLGKALTRQGCLALSMGQPEKAADCLGDGLRFLRELNLREEVAFNLLHSGRLSDLAGDHTWAAGLNRESLDIYRKLGDKLGVANALANLASQPLLEPEESKKLFRDSLSIFSDLKDSRGIGVTSRKLGEVHLRLGEFEEARRCYEESLIIDRQLGDGRNASASLFGLGEALARSGDPRAALDIYGRGVDICRDIGYRVGTGEGLVGLGGASMLLEDEATSLVHYREALAISLESASVPLGLEALLGLGSFLAHRGEPEEALEIAGCVLAHGESGPGARSRAESLRNGLSPGISAQAAKKALARGKRASWEDLARRGLEEFEEA